MKFKELLTEETNVYEIKEIQRSDMNGLKMFSDFYNDSGELTWKLTASRLASKIGSRGSAFGLYDSLSNMLVGTIAVKEIEGDLGEIGYLMIEKEHRSLPNVIRLFKAAIKSAKRFDVLFATTNIKNKGINKLLNRTPKSDLLLKVKSPFGGGRNKLFVWTINHRGVMTEDKIQAIKNNFQDLIMKEY